MKWRILLVIAGVVAAGIAWWLLSPLLIDDVVNEDLPAGLTEEVEKMPDVVVDEEMMEPKDTPAQMEVAEVKAPLMVASGEFRDGDDFHKGSGKVKLFQQADGTKLLRLEDFDVTNGPDLFVYLTQEGNVKNSDDVKKGFYDVAALKGNKGNQNYVLPEDVDLDDYKGVVIYCRAFSVLFAAADLN